MKIPAFYDSGSTHSVLPLCTYEQIPSDAILEDQKLDIKLLGASGDNISLHRLITLQFKFSNDPQEKLFKVPFILVKDLLELDTMLILGMNFAENYGPIVIHAKQGIISLPSCKTILYTSNQRPSANSNFKNEMKENVSSPHRAAHVNTKSMKSKSSSNIISDSSKNLSTSPPLYYSETIIHRSPISNQEFLKSAFSDETHAAELEKGNVLTNDIELQQQTVGRLAQPERLSKIERNGFESKTDITRHRDDPLEESQSSPYFDYIFMMQQNRDIKGTANPLDRTRKSSREAEHKDRIFPSALSETPEPKSSIAATTQISPEANSRTTCSEEDKERKKEEKETAIVEEVMEELIRRVEENSTEQQQRTYNRTFTMREVPICPYDSPMLAWSNQKPIQNLRKVVEEEERRPEDNVVEVREKLNLEADTVGRKQKVDKEIIAAEIRNKLAREVEVEEEEHRRRKKIEEKSRRNTRFDPSDNSSHIPRTIRINTSSTSPISKRFYQANSKLERSDSNVYNSDDECHKHICIFTGMKNKHKYESSSRYPEYKKATLINKIPTIRLSKIKKPYTPGTSREEIDKFLHKRMYDSNDSVEHLSRMFSNDPLPSYNEVDNPPANHKISKEPDYLKLYEKKPVTHKRYEQKLSKIDEEPDSREADLVVDSREVELVEDSKIVEDIVERDRVVEQEEAELDHDCLSDNTLIKPCKSHNQENVITHQSINHVKDNLLISDLTSSMINIPTYDSHQSFDIIEYPLIRDSNFADHIEFPCELAPNEDNPFPESLSTYSEALQAIDHVESKIEENWIQDNDDNPLFFLMTHRNDSSRQVYRNLSSQFIGQFNFKNVPPEETLRLKTILIANRDVFALENDKLGCTDTVLHRINTQNAKPVHSQPYRLEQIKALELDSMIDNMLEQGIIRHSNSEWSSPVVLVPKPSGKWRICIDYRKLNAVTIPDQHPIPRIDDSLDVLQGAKYFSKLDCKSGFWQVKMLEEDIHKTAFCTRKGLYEFTVMPFGLSNSARTFERLMNRVLEGLMFQTVLVYLDDILIFSHTIEEHYDRLKSVFERFRLHNLKIEVSKCEFFCQSIKFLGHLISSHGILPDPEKIKVVQNYPKPTNPKQIKQFLGLSTFYRRFCKDYAKIASPLSNLLRKNVEWHWNQEQETAFSSLKTALTTAPFLKYPDYSKDFILQTDASNFCIAAILLQKYDNILHPLSYASRRLTLAEEKYPVMEKEALACIYGISKFKHHLTGRKFILQTDHQSLKYIFSLIEPKARVSRWVLYLQSFNYEIEYKPGKTHHLPDALSRNPSTERPKVSEEEQEEFIFSIDEDITSCTKFCQKLKIAQAKDPLCQDIIDQIYRKKNTSNFCISDKGILTLVKVESKVVLELPYIPDSMIDEVLAIIHGHIVGGGHFAFSKTYLKVQSQVYFPNMYTKVKEFCEQCLDCKIVKKQGIPPQPLLQPLEIPNRPFERVHMDITGPFTRTPKGNVYCIAFICRLSKFVIATAISSKSSAEIAHTLVHDVILKFGPIEHLYSDAALEFKDRIMSNLYDTLYINKHSTIPYHPAGNGQVENIFKTFKHMLRLYISQTQAPWDELLDYITHAHNVTPHLSTKFSPFELIFGRKPSSTLQVMLGQKQHNYAIGILPEAYASEVQLKLQNSWKLAKAAAEAAKEDQRKFYDQKARPHKFQVNDLVLTRNRTQHVGVPSAFINPFIGPFIIENIGNTSADIRNLENHSVRTVHVQDLKFWKKPSIIQSHIPKSGPSLENLTPPSHLSPVKESNSTTPALMNEPILSQSEHRSHDHRIPNPTLVSEIRPNSVPERSSRTSYNLRKNPKPNPKYDD